MLPIFSKAGGMVMAMAMLVVGLFFIPARLWAQPGELNPSAPIKAEELMDCYARSSHVMFRCDPDWKVRIVDEHSTIITISSDPFVTLAISRIESPIRYLGQLNRSFFASGRIYLDNFRNDYVKFAGGDAMQLKAFSKSEPDMRYLGYFYLNDAGLNSVFFAVYPKESWDDYKFLIKRITDSFRRL